MKVNVKASIGNNHIDQDFEGKTADEVVSAMQKAAAAKAGFAIRLFINSMSPLSFAQEVVKRYNQETRKSMPIPSSCDEFIEQGQTEGIVTILEP